MATGSGSSGAPGIDQTNFLNEDELRVWVDQTMSTLKLIVLELNSSKQVLYHLLANTPTPNPESGRRQSSRRGAKSVSNKIGRAETDLMAAAAAVAGAYRVFETVFLGQVASTGGGKTQKGMSVPHARTRNRNSSSTKAAA